MNYRKLVNLAKDIRVSCLKMTHSAKSSHIGSCLSIIEILVIIYWKYNPKGFKDDNFFILSKGHAASALYLVLAFRGFFPKNHLFQSILSS